MGNLTHLTLINILSGLTQTASKCSSLRSLNRYVSLQKIYVNMEQHSVPAFVFQIFIPLLRQLLQEMQILV